MRFIRGEGCGLCTGRADYAVVILIFSFICLLGKDIKSKRDTTEYSWLSVGSLDTRIEERTPRQTAGTIRDDEDRCMKPYLANLTAIQSMNRKLCPVPGNTEHRDPDSHREELCDA